MTPRGHADDFLDEYIVSTGHDRRCTFKVIVATDQGNFVRRADPLSFAIGATNDDVFETIFLSFCFERFFAVNVAQECDYTSSLSCSCRPIEECVFQFVRARNFLQARIDRRMQGKIGKFCRMILVDE